MQKQSQAEEVHQPDTAKIELAFLRRQRTKWGQSMLLDLANLDSGDFRQFRKHWSVFFPPESMGQDDDRIRAWRDELRQVWSLGLETGRILDRWTKEDPYPNRWFIPLWLANPRYIEPNPAHLPFVLALTIRDLVGKLGRCPNPECPQPYFIKGRKNQTFCDRPACAAYGRREYKRRWWSKGGEKWRRKWKRDRKLRTKKHRKGGR